MCLSAAYPAGNGVETPSTVTENLSAAYPAGNILLFVVCIPWCLSAAYPAGNLPPSYNFNEPSTTWPIQIVLTILRVLLSNTLISWAFSEWHQKILWPSSRKARPFSIRDNWFRLI
jgi:hypothetical protein